PTFSALLLLTALCPSLSPPTFRTRRSSTLRACTSPVAEFDMVGRYRVTLRAQDDPHPDYPYPSHVFAEYRKDSNDFWQLLVVHRDRKSTRLHSSHVEISYAVFCLKKKKVL